MRHLSSVVQRSRTKDGYALRSALCEKLEAMPAIASLEDLKAAQKEGLSIYAIRHALCELLVVARRGYP